MSSTSWRTLAVLGALAVTALGVSGCASPSEVSDEPSGTAAGLPNFQGPNAAEYENAWLEAESDFVRGILEDEMISEQEWSEVTNQLRSCVEALGMTFKGFDPDGSYGVDLGKVPEAESDDALLTCERQSGEQWAGYLRWLATENPQGKPIEEIMTECLIRTGVVGADYTPEEYLRDVPTRDFPYLDPKSGPAAFWTCNSNPSTGS